VRDEDGYGLEVRDSYANFELEFSGLVVSCPATPSKKVSADPSVTRITQMERGKEESERKIFRILSECWVVKIMPLI
jgi:hypothetical protein